MSPLEVAQWQIAESWAKDLDLEHEGVDLAESLKYVVLSVIGNLLLGAKNDEVTHA